MAIDNAEKRRSAGAVFWVFVPAGVTPNASPDQEWKQQSGWSYSGIAVAALPITVLFPEDTYSLPITYTDTYSLETVLTDVFNIPVTPTDTYSK